MVNGHGGHRPHGHISLFQHSHVYIVIHKAQYVEAGFLSAIDVRDVHQCVVGYEGKADVADKVCVSLPHGQPHKDLIARKTATNINFKI